MEANELMIGDWVKVHFGEHNETIGSDVYGQVAELYDYGRIEVAFNGSSSVLWNIEKERGDEILPIPLTQEILEKNGFEKIEGCVTAEAYILDKGEWGEANLIIRRFDFNESFVICTPKDQTARISIGYVHELQHALRLAGIKKEIVL